MLKEHEIKMTYGSLEMYEKANFYEIKQKKLEELKFKNLKTYKNSIVYNNEFESECNLIKDIYYFNLPKFASSENLYTEEDLRRKSEMRKEQSKRLRELMQKKREENLRQLGIELVELNQLMTLKDGERLQFEEAIQSRGFTCEEELQKRINKIYLKINFNQKNEEEKIDVEKRWPYLNIPDEDLTEEQIRMKKIQKMQKQAHLNRLEKREKQRIEKERVEDLKNRDPESYLVNLYRRKKEIIDRLEKYKAARRDISNRSSKAIRGRLMVLAELSSCNEGKTQDIVDDFGMKDEDWEVYRGISRNNLSEDEEEDQQQLQEVEAQIIENDPNYYNYTEDISKKLFYSSNNICLGVDQFRGAEILFEPYLIGLDYAGITEIILSIFKTMNNEEKRKLAGNIFLTGGFTKTKFLKERIYKDLRANLDCDIEININLADNPELDAWKGAKDFYNKEENKKFYITKEEYREYGYDYFLENSCSNNKICYRGSGGYSHEIGVNNKKQKLI
jgi:actin-related protein 5